MTYTPHVLETLPGQVSRLSAGTMSNLTGYTDYGRIDAIRAEFIDFCREMTGHFETWALAWPEFVKAKAGAGEFFLNCTHGGYSRETFLGIRSERLAKIMLTQPNSDKSALKFEISRMTIALEDYGGRAIVGKGGGRWQGTWNVYDESDVRY